jgi:site-specific DNA-methyltransferase (adenine-specific)
MIKIIRGECLAEMDKLITEGITVDAIITDPPYGTTACKWDSVIPFDAMWERLNKLIKPNGAIVLFGSEPFSSALRMSNIKNYKYDWVWEKHHKTGHLNAKKRPMKKVENISIFYNKQCLYNPQGLIKVEKVMKNSNSDCLRGKNNKTSTVSGGLSNKPYIQEYENYPHEILKFNSMNGNTQHPTQKPVPLMEYLIKTYTNEGETVLDFTMGSGTTGVACKQTGRNFIGIELDDGYFQIAKERIIEAKKKEQA